MRGRLINAFVAELAQLDTAATAADPDSTGPLVSGYDPIFREPYKLPTDGTDARKEKTAILIDCQVEVNTWEMLQQVSSGNLSPSAIKLVFHFRDLELMGLVASNGDALIRTGDRLVTIRKKLDGSVIQTIHAERGGLYCTEAQVQSFGLSGGARNLLICTFEPRARGIEAP